MVKLHAKKQDGFITKIFSMLQKILLAALQLFLSSAGLYSISLRRSVWHSSYREMIIACITKGCLINLFFCENNNKVFLCCTQGQSLCKTAKYKSLHLGPTLFTEICILYIVDKKCALFATRFI